MRARTLLDFSQYGTEEEFKKQLSKMFSRLKLKGASKEALEAIAVELRSIYVETLQSSLKNLPTLIGCISTSQKTVFGMRATRRGGEGWL